MPNPSGKPDGIQALVNVLSENEWTQDAEIIAPHLVEWRDKYFGKTPIMVMPRSTQAVSDILKICTEFGLKVTPQGGNTGLVGGQTPQGEILLSLKNMTKVRDINVANNSITVEAGASLQSVQEAALSVDRKFPLSLASEGTCTIGGNLSTNAGGVHVLKYGTTKDLVFGVEAVLADGRIFNGLTDLRKDNTGYDLNRLFLGAEGTLGIITAACLKLFPNPKYVQRAIVGVETPMAAMALLDQCRAGSHLAMFEVMPRIGLDLVLTHIDGQRNPFEASYPWYAVIDWEVETEAQGLDIAEARLGPALESGVALDVVIAQNQTQAGALLALRENMSAAQKFNGGSVKFDITVPLSKIPEFFERADKAVEKVVPNCRPVGFGHFGDGNIHYNIAQPLPQSASEGFEIGKAAYLEQWDAMSEAVFDVVDALDGSISAEHGIGIMKKDDLALRADPVKFALLKSVKNALDPQNILNPRIML